MLSVNPKALLLSDFLAFLSRSHDVWREPTWAVGWPRGPLVPACSNLKLHSSPQLKQGEESACSAHKFFSTCQAPPTSALEICQCVLRSEACCASQASVHVSQCACGAGGHVPDRCVCVLGCYLGAVRRGCFSEWEVSTGTTSQLSYFYYSCEI